MHVIKLYYGNSLKRVDMQISYNPKSHRDFQIFICYCLFLCFYTTKFFVIKCECFQLMLGRKTFPVSTSAKLEEMRVQAQNLERQKCVLNNSTKRQNIFFNYPPSSGISSVSGPLTR